MDENILEPGQVKDSAEYIAKLEQLVEHGKTLREIVGHEMRNRINSMINFPWLLAKEINSDPDLTPEAKSKMTGICDIIKKNAKQLESIATILHLGSLNHTDLKKASKQFNLEEMTRENILSLEKDLIDNQLGISYEYNRIEESPIYVFAHEGFMNATLNTTLFNLIKHAPKGSMSRLGLSIQGESLELLCENLIGKSREGYGSNTGVGFYLLDLARKQMRGTLKLETSRAEREYQRREVIGYKDAKELEDHDIFSLRFSIPMKELTFHPPKKQ